LKTRWFGLLIASLVFTTTFFFILRSFWQETYALRWFLLAGAGSAYLLWVVWKGLPDNHRPGETALLPGLGWGNLLTWLRGLWLIWLAGFLFLPRPEGWLGWLPGSLYLLAALADLFDGYLARRANTLSRLGEKLDLLLDGLGVLVAAAMIVQYGQVQTWYLLVGLARYLFLGGSWLRTRLDKPVYDLPPSASRRPLAGAQMGFIAVMLFPIFSPPATYLAAALFGLPFLIGFARDWLAVSGRGKLVSSDHASSLGAYTSRLLGQAKGWLPVVLRLLVIGLIIALLIDQLGAIPGLLAWSWNYSGGGQALAWFYALLALEILAAVLLGLGAAGRVAALAVLFSLGLYLQVSGMTPVILATAVGAAGLFFLGTGPFSLWAPETALIRKRLGEA
jgi:CDP-diacylglycerol--glycerol-3-phosphate 3-phosphatidyltransferase